MMSCMKAVSILLLSMACQFAGAAALDEMLDAVKKNDVSTVSQLLKRGVDVATTDQHGPC